MRKKVLGFTLIELMIVIAIIAIIAAIAIPGLLRARISANEGSCSAGMRSIASAQINYRKSTSVDQDQNGLGEFGLFNELSGGTLRRGYNVTSGTVASFPALTTTDLSVSLQTGGNVYTSKSGYYMQMWLPGNAATVTDVAAGAAVVVPFLDGTVAADAVAITAQESKWIVYGWPASYRSSGVRAFVCNEGAEVFASSNTDATNAGYFKATTAMPVWNTALNNTTVPTTTDWTNISAKDNVNAVDTNHKWLPAGA